MIPSFGSQILSVFSILFIACLQTKDFDIDIVLWCTQRVESIGANIESMYLLMGKKYLGTALNIYF